MRRRTDHLHASPLGSREREALRLVEDQPGITIGELADRLGVGMNRVLQIVSRLERRPFVRREPKR